MKVARHGFDPRVGDTDQRAAEISICETNSLKHRPSTRAGAPFRNSTTDMFQIHVISPAERLQDRFQSFKVSRFQGFKVSKTGAQVVGRLNRRGLSSKTLNFETCFYKKRGTRSLQVPQDA